MAEASKIEWTDATVNFWWGCTKVSAACDHCYAETWARRFSGQHWGAEAPRRKIKTARAMLDRLDNDYSEWAADFHSGHLPAGCRSRRRVFCMSMGDLFDKEVPIEWFVEAWQTIKACDRVDIIIVTKRLSMIERRLGEAGFTDWPQHAWLLTSVHDQASADREGPRLLDLKSKFGIPVVGFSIEPLLGPIDLTRPIDISGDYECFLLGVPPERIEDCEGDVPPHLDWIIAGGESGPDARPAHPDWLRGLRDQCAAAGVPFFFKQWGEWKPISEMPEAEYEQFYRSNKVAKSGEDQGDLDDIYGRRCTIPTDAIGYTGLRGDAAFHVVDGKGGMMMFRVGRARAGRTLDGVEHNEFPEPRA
jgi:protein gp37